MSDRLLELTAFVRAAETGSFSQTARELGLSQPSVSRMVAALEERLAVKLLLRTTRKVMPTESGATFLARARQVLADLEEAEGEARGRDSLRGLLRVAMPGAFGVREVVPRLPAFLADHPQLGMEFLVSDRHENLVTEGVDLALRFGPLSDSGFGARRLARAPRHLVAAPAYLAARGTPATLSELAAHDCIFGPGVAGRAPWNFSRDGAETSVAVEGRVQIATADGLVACAKMGLGIAIASHWMCRAEIASGELVVILGEYALRPAEVFAVFPGGRRPSPKARAFADYLASELAG
jgi:DNA-binding transcriptional LysR family regulator